MAKPRIFISSTYYDLKYIRTSLESFIHSFGYEPVLFESGDIFFSHEKPLDESCYAELKNCHMQILIIGGSYGSANSSLKLSEEDKKDPYKIFNSITKTEFEVAHKRQIPIYFFVENGVLSEYNTYKKNRDNKTIKYANVSSVNIFSLLDDIHTLQKGNFIQGFTKFEDISEWLKMQWAHLMTEFISNRSRQIEIADLNDSVDKLSSITSSLKAYTEEILKKVEPDNFAKIKSDQDKIIQVYKLDIIEKSDFCKFIKRNRTGLISKELYDNLVSSDSMREFLEKTLSKKKANEMLNDPNLAYDKLEQDFNDLKSRVGS